MGSLALGALLYIQRQMFGSESPPPLELTTRRVEGVGVGFSYQEEVMKNVPLHVPLPPRKPADGGSEPGSHIAWKLFGHGRR